MGEGEGKRNAEMQCCIKAAKTLAVAAALLRPVFGRLGRRQRRLFPAYGVNTPYTTVPELLKGTRTTDSGSDGGESHGPYSERLFPKPLFLLW
jgi:hypothetical protein